MLPSTVRLAISLATLPFAKRRALGRVASAFCSRKKQVDDLIYNEKGNEALLIKYINPPASQTGS